MRKGATQGPRMCEPLPPLPLDKYQDILMSLWRRRPRAVERFSPGEDEVPEEKALLNGSGEFELKVLCWVFVPRKESETKIIHIRAK